MMQIVRRYKWVLCVLCINLLLLLVKPSIGLDSIMISIDNLSQMLIVIPPIFILLGLLDVWVPRETIINLMGKDSGLIGVTIAFILGAASAGPLYAAFPIAGVLMKKGSRLFNVLLFIGAWSTTKIPLLLFEASTMGLSFMFTRLIIDIFVIMLIAYITEKLITIREQEMIFKNIEKL